MQVVCMNFFSIKAIFAKL